MQAPKCEPDLDKGFWHAVGLVARAVAAPRKGEESGGRGSAAALSQPEDRPMARPSTRQGVTIRAHRADWP